MRTQWCPRLWHTLLHRLSTPDSFVSHDVSDPRFDIEQDPLQYLLSHRSNRPDAHATPKGDPGDRFDRRIGEKQIRT